MHYTFHQLRVFLEVVKQQSITKAAEEMHMTQPALSIQLKNFQAQFDVPLTGMSGRQLFVTDFGKEIALLADKLLEDANAIEYRTKAYEGLVAGKLKISSASTGKYVMPYFLSGFMQEHRGIDLSLDVTNKSRVLESMRENEVDFALVSVLPEMLEIEEETLLDNHLYMVGASREEESDKPMIFRETGSATRKAMDEYLEKKQIRKPMELTSNEAVKQAVIAGLGYSVIPLIGIHNELMNEQLYIYERPGLPIITKWRLIWLKNKLLSPAATAYLNYVRGHKDQIISEKFGWVKKYVRETSLQP
ncbi:LysR family transcriptional regulator [Roseivirga sp. BDSF3-8]|uniref:LysR family transcriptional regulator n=1 Tax=Roseivirga sp. BDSF3-8 TaxID=3241598 RepID=UPI0035325CF9